ncbi:MAG: patatin-like phospholipase family protein, partial [Cyclobacteriaceae bacterium]
YDIELGIHNGKPELPRGLIDGQRFSETLSTLTRHVHDVHDFSKLPIPYACVATDIATGQPVVLNSGSLPQAIRASMAIPSIFTPVEISDQLLVDGGLVRNFPVPECRDMGADIIIGVFVSGGLLEKEKLRSAVDVLSQSAFVLSAFDSEEQKTKCDLLIEPDISKFSTMGFGDTPSIIKSGEEAAASARPALKILADTLNLPPMEPVTVKNMPNRDTVRIRRIVVQNNEHIPESYVSGRMRIKENENISINDIERRVDAIFGTGYFHKLTYELGPNEEGTYDLILNVEESYQSQLKFALHYDTENRAGVTLNYTHRNLIPASRLLLEGDIAENPRANVSFLKYVGPSQSLALKLGLNYRNSDVPNLESANSQLTGVFRNRYFNPYLNIFQTSRRNYSVGVTGQYESSVFKPKIGGEDIRTLNKLDWRSWSGKFYGVYNALNHRYFPTAGAKYEASLKYTFSVDYSLEFMDSDEVFPISVDVDPFATLHAGHQNFWPVSRWLTIGISNIIIMNMIDRSDEDIGSLPYINDQLLIGGYRPLLANGIAFWGGKATEYYADNLFYNQIMLQFNPGTDLYIQMVSQYVNAAYPMKWIYSKITEDSYFLGDNVHALLGYGAMLSYTSLIGPVSVGIASHNHTSRWNAFFSIGFYF